MGGERAEEKIEEEINDEENVRRRRKRCLQADVVVDNVGVGADGLNEEGTNPRLLANELCNHFPIPNRKGSDEQVQ